MAAITTIDKTTDINWTGDFAVLFLRSVEVVFIIGSNWFESRAIIAAAGIVSEDIS